LRCRPSGKATSSSDSADGDEGRGQALGCASRHEPHRFLRQPPGQRGCREDEHAQDECAAAADQVTHSPAEQQETTEQQGVRVGDPRQAGGGEAEIAAIDGIATPTMAASRMSTN